MCLLITTKYASYRLSNGPSGLSDTPIGKFQLFNNQIIPLIAKTFVYNMGLLYIRKIYSDYIVNSNKYDANYWIENRYDRKMIQIKWSEIWSKINDRKYDLK